MRVTFPLYYGRTSHTIVALQSKLYMKHLMLHKDDDGLDDVSRQIAVPDETGFPVRFRCFVKSGRKVWKNERKVVPLHAQC